MPTFSSFAQNKVCLHLKNSNFFKSWLHLDFNQIISPKLTEYFGKYKFSQINAIFFSRRKHYFDTL
jgi:hypothetical protein